MAPFFSEEVVSTVAPARLFQAGVVDLHKIAPQIVSDMVSGAMVLEGDGGVGTIRQFNFTEALPYGYVKERIDVLDKENFEYKYTLIEGGDIGKKLVSAVYHFKIVSSSGGGCVCKISAEYTTIPGVEFTEEDIKVDKEEAIGMFKAVEEYLLATPEAYA